MSQTQQEQAMETEALLSAVASQRDAALNSAAQLAAKLTVHNRMRAEELAAAEKRGSEALAAAEKRIADLLHENRSMRAMLGLGTEE